MARAEGTFTVKNDTRMSLDLWVWREAKNSWTTIEVPKGEDVIITPLTEGNCYLVVRHRNSAQDYYIGWYDLKAIAANNKAPVLRLSLSVLKEMKMEQGPRGPRTVEVEVRVIRGKWVDVSSSIEK
jgi:hypothetical protein